MLVGVRVAATDIESKLAESGLANIQLADLRNFAHGRHLWLKRHGGSTAIVALETREWADLFNKTLALLPASVEIIRLKADQGGPFGAIELVVHVMRLIGQIASSQGLDPGRPVVPEFGRKLYHLSVQESRDRVRKPTSCLLLKRKFGNNVVAWPQRALDNCRKGLTEYLERLQNTWFQAVVFDYDETLCSATYRFGSLPPDMSGPLSNILENGIVVGVASGRGDSLRTSLRESIDVSLWGRVIVGYYSGSIVQKLSEDASSGGNPKSPNLKRISEILQAHSLLSQLCKIETRPNQTSLIPPTRGPLSLIQELVIELLKRENCDDLPVLRSSHAVDVLSSGVSKLSVVSACLAELGEAGETGNIMRIGDSGAWHGNDFDLLSSPLGLSVSDCPKNTYWAWNLAAPGHSRTEATLDYMRALRFRNGSFSINVKKLVQDI